MAGVGRGGRRARAEGRREKGRNEQGREVGKCGGEKERKDKRKRWEDRRMERAEEPDEERRREKEEAEKRTEESREGEKAGERRMGEVKKWRTAEGIGAEVNWRR